MATQFSPTPTSNISELNGLGATSSITLPKKRHWKLAAISLAAFLTVMGSSYLVSQMEFVRALFTGMTSVAEEPTEQSVPLAPNPEVMPNEMQALDEAPVPALAPVVETKPVMKAVVKSKTMSAKSGKKTLVKAHPKSKKAIAKSKMRKAKVVAKSHKMINPKFTQKVASQTKKTAKAQP